ncbi:MAG: hypothetical protein J6J60_08905 [Clostridia bacterium]|nr:hypothetical protein [Clostridia bacterium]
MYNSIEKICSFYASELHLTTILMQYIYEKTKEGRKILNVLERDLIKEAESVIELFKCKNALKSDIKSIGWNKANKEFINKLENSYDEDIIIVAGSQEFIEGVKEKLPKNNKIVIDCYELLENASDAMDVLENHDYILMTDGIKKVKEVFA